MNILNFCSQAQDERRAYVKTPWFLDGHTVATDSRIMIRAKDVGPWPVADEDKYPVDGARKLFTESESKDLSWSPAPKVSISRCIGSLCRRCRGIGKLQITICEECEGARDLHFSTDYNDYEVECESCYGHGGSSRPDHHGNTICEDCGGAGYILPDLDICGVLVDFKLLSKAMPIENLELAGDPLGTKLFFRGSGATGLIMGKFRDDQRTYRPRG